MRSDAKTDFWRITHDGGVRDNGHFYYAVAEGDFVATVHVEGDFRSLYDQVGLMLRVDEKNWLKCGIEYFDEQCHRSVVVTREFSDWSIVSQGEARGLWLRAKRQGATVEVSVSDDGEHFALFRQSYLSDSRRIQVGMMAASPGDQGFEARFDRFALS